MQRHCQISCVQRNIRAGKGKKNFDFNADEHLGAISINDRDESCTGEKTSGGMCSIQRSHSFVFSMNLLSSLVSCFL